jgi:hypothetical protein
MGRFGLLAACCVLALGTAARADVTGVTGSSSAVISLDGQRTFDAPGTFSQGNNGSTVAPTFAIDPSHVTFQAGSASSGDFVTSISNSTVNITIQNTGSAAVLPTLQSQITAAGMGFYLGDRAGGCGGDIYTGCAQTTGGQTFADLSNRGLDPGTVIAGAAFDFKVSDGSTTLFDFTGSQSVTVAADGSLVVGDLVLSSPNVLQGLVKLTPGGDGSALGFAWDASDITLGLGALLNVGDSRTITYSSTVETFSRTDCTSDDPDVCLIVYSAFGDPVGRGGGVEDLKAGGFSSFAKVGGAQSAGGDLIGGLNFAPTVFDIPTFQNGVVSFQATTGGVPEPETWAMLIAGFGFMGAALRRRRVPALS